MLTSLPLYGIIYYNILNWIVSGTYKTGDKLPSRAELAQRFGASEDTVRKALSALLEHGYISMRRGSTPVVRLDADDPAQRSQLSERYESRRGTVLDILHAYRFVVPPFIHTAISSLNRSETIALFRTLRASLRLDQDAFTQSSCQIIERLLRHNQNDNISYFYSTTELFLRLTMYNAEPTIAKKDELIDARRKLFRWLTNRIRLFLKEGEKLTRRYISAGIVWYVNTIIRLLNLDSDPQREAAGIYYKTQPKYISICMDLLQRMWAGQFGMGSFLPSDAAVAAEYRVAAPTARKAYKVLNHLGLVRTVPKVGTQVIFTSQLPVEWRIGPKPDPMYRQMFLDCLWFWKIAIRGTALTACQDAPSLAAKLTPVENRCAAAPPVLQMYSFVSLLDRIVKHTGNTTIYSIFELNKSILFFGLHPLRICKPELCDALCRDVHQGLEDLRAGNAQAFSTKLAHILERLFDEANAFYEISAEPERLSVRDRPGIMDPEGELSYFSLQKTRDQ